MKRPINSPYIGQFIYSPPSDETLGSLEWKEVSEQPPQPRGYVIDESGPIPDNLGVLNRDFLPTLNAVAAVSAPSRHISGTLHVTGYARMPALSFENIPTVNSVSELYERQEFIDMPEDSIVPVVARFPPYDGTILLYKTSSPPPTWLFVPFQPLQEDT